MAASSQSPIIADPNQEFSSADYLAMQQALAARAARDATAKQALRDAFAAQASTLVAMPEFAPLHEKVKEILASTPRDDNMVLHMEALNNTLDRIVANVSA